MSDWEEGKFLRSLRVVTIIIILAFGAWHFAEVGFDWRAAIHTTSPWAFFCAMAILPVLGFPISVCYIYAGVAFSPWIAVLVCWAALFVNMSVSYWLTRSILKTPIERFLKERNWSIPELSEAGHFRFTFLMRTIPGPPFFVQNLTLGLSGVPYGIYLWASMLGQGSIALGMILCSRYVSQNPFGKVGITVICVLIALVLAKTIKEIKDRKSDAPTLE